MLLLKPAVERYMERFPHEVDDPLEIGHWSVLKSVKELLEAVKLASLKLESETAPTGGQALGVFHKLIVYLDDEAMGVGRRTESEKQVLKLAGGIRDKLLQQLTCPNWLFGLAFLALMDVSGECICAACILAEVHGQAQEI